MAQTVPASGSETIRSLIPARIDRLRWSPFHTRAIIGTLGTYILLNNLDLNWAWRIGFLIGPVIGLAIWGA